MSKRIFTAEEKAKINNALDVMAKKRAALQNALKRNDLAKENQCKRELTEAVKEVNNLLDAPPQKSTSRPVKTFFNQFLNNK